MIDNYLAESISIAIQSSCDEISKQSKGITGYALCTDDEIRTIYHVATALPHDGERAFWAIPAEWTIVARSAKPLFERISKYLHARAEEAHEKQRTEQHVEMYYGLLVASLEQQREIVHKLGQSEVLLQVASTDPSAKLTRLQIESTKRLNSPGLFKHWHVAHHGRLPADHS